MNLSRMNASLFQSILHQEHLQHLKGSGCQTIQKTFVGNIKQISKLNLKAFNSRYFPLDSILTVSSQSVELGLMLFDTSTPADDFANFMNVSSIVVSTTQSEPGRSCYIACACVCACACICMYMYVYRGKFSIFLWYIITFSITPTGGGHVGSRQTM